MGNVWLIFLLFARIAESHFSLQRVQEAQLFLRGCPQASCYDDTWLWWSLTFWVQNWFTKVQMCRGTQIHTLIYLAYIPMSEQGQLPKSAANQEGIFGFQERTNKMTQRDTVCSDSNGDDAGRYKYRDWILKLCNSLLHGTRCACIWGFQIYITVPFKVAVCRHRQIPLAKA